MARVALLGSTGTVGLATARALVAAGHEVVAYGRRPPEVSGVAVRLGGAAEIVERLAGERFDAFVSCLASRTGSPRDAWAVDYAGNLAALQAAEATGARRFVLLSAICVQKPKLAFQHAKLAFEDKLKNSGLEYSIVRATALFKSLSGQVARVQAGKAFLAFGDGRLTACKPISDADLARYLAACVTDPARRNRILPIGGPGPAITPRDQAEALSRLLGREVKLRRAPVALLDGIVGALSVAALLSRKAAETAEFARIGRYYATESMLVWDAAVLRYDDAATPETGADTLFDYYARLISGEARVALREHAAF